MILTGRIVNARFPWQGFDVNIVINMVPLPSWPNPH